MKKSELWGSIPKCPRKKVHDNKLINDDIINFFTTVLLKEPESDNINIGETGNESTAVESDIHNTDKSEYHDVLSDKIESDEDSENTVEDDELSDLFDEAISVDVDFNELIKNGDFRRTKSVTQCQHVDASASLNWNEFNCDKKILQTIRLADYCDHVLTGGLKSLQDPVEHDELFNKQDDENVFQFTEKINMKRFSRFDGYNRTYTESVEIDHVPDIDSKLAHYVLKSSVAVICAFSGFSQTTENCLDVLTEVTEDYMAKVFRLLSVNMDKFSLDNKNYGFQDPIDRTCHEVGLDGVRDLLEFYQESILNHMNETCQKYQNLNELQMSVTEDEQSDIKNENDNESPIEIPELQIPNDNLILNDIFGADYDMLDEFENSE